MKTPPTILIGSHDFNDAWARAVRSVVRDGVDIVIGSTEEPKPIRDSCMTIALSGNAIAQIQNYIVHDQYPFEQISHYCDEFTRDYLKEYLEKSDREQFSYTYLERLVMYQNEDHYNGDQLHALRDHLAMQCASGISSNRHQAITWQPETDIGSAASPCLQRIWIRMLEPPRKVEMAPEREKFDGPFHIRGQVEVHLTWRSRDLYHAWQANMIALIEMLNREVIHPNNCEIVKIVDFADSMHIYHHSIEQAKEVQLVPTNPLER